MSGGILKSDVKSPFLSGFTFCVGSQDDAVAFRSPIYAAELGSAGVDQADPLAAHLIALDSENRIRACLRVEDARCRPFSVESFVDIGPRVSSISSTAEISRFVVHPSVRAIRSDRFIHMGILKLVYEHSVKCGLTDLVTLSLPHLDRLYEMALFEKIGAPGEHPVWGTVQPMHMNISRAKAKARARPTRFTELIFNAHLSNVIP